eukprot:1263451-Rhodomonas_salina.1
MTGRKFYQDVRVLVLVPNVPRVQLRVAFPRPGRLRMHTRVQQPLHWDAPSLDLHFNFKGQSHGPASSLGRGLSDSASPGIRIRIRIRIDAREQQQHHHHVTMMCE